MVSHFHVFVIQADEAVTWNPRADVPLDSDGERAMTLPRSNNRYPLDRGPNTTMLDVCYFCSNSNHSFSNSKTSYFSQSNSHIDALAMDTSFPKCCFNHLCLAHPPITEVGD